ncbi:hypothetical protein SAPIO_CDS9510 [Scedosporium apiospermum]|uniref:Uncharacterized protein n=1 Tax=Pseudallescheria apiosperma TaxID=563466 RepID=A0A084FWY4_PSEDA|nr:uncharacterized protein SAPIO_CDS9510 [Scedosporium apiospermum]KEZ39596.1 hypothetical protein SAPIO_CDS9510 [Scedosporium apiospermum]
MRKQVFLLGEVDRTRKCLTRSPSSASFYFIGADDSFFLQQVNVGISKQAGRYAIPKSEKPVKQSFRHPKFDVRWRIIFWEGAAVSTESCVEDLPLACEASQGQTRGVNEKE